MFRIGKKGLYLIIPVLLCLISSCSGQAPASSPSSLQKTIESNYNDDLELERLMEGNLDYLKSVDHELLKTLFEKGQDPFAAVITCSDSRVPVEDIFNQLQPGSLFVIRIAGNVVGDASVNGSIEYAVSHLGVKCVILMGHTMCGAVEASLRGSPEGEVGRLLTLITVESHDIDKAVNENIENQVNRIMAIEAVKEAIEKKSLQFYGMCYDTQTGRVSLLSINGKAVRSE
jgi:carbonic anhydrase